MRSMMVPTAVAALAAVVLTLPVQAASSHKRHSQYARATSYGVAYTGPATTTHNASIIYRFWGHYWRTDPDQQIRFSLQRDGRNYPH